MSSFKAINVQVSNNKYSMMVVYCYHCLLGSVTELTRAVQWENFFELALNKVTRGLRCKLCNKPNGTLG